MFKNYLWTKSKARLQLSCSDNSGQYNWLFLPGGPGLGSEYLHGLGQILSLPGAVWYIDLPGDGSNNTEDDAKSFAHWSLALTEAVSNFENVILVAHSSGGFFTLATPALEKKLTGLVLADSSPNASWQQAFLDYVQQHPIAEAQRLQALYNATPSNELLKKLTIACAPYFSTDEGLKKTIALLEDLPFNHKTHQWAEKNFDSTYHAKWIPKEIPTLLFAGDQDHLTPLALFANTPEFKRNNILIREIENASHFPWIDNPDRVKQLFTEYYQLLTP